MIPTPNPVIAGLAKESDMGSKPILESTADVPEPSIVRFVRRCMIESVIYRCKGRVYGVSSRAGEKTAAAAEYVWRQVNTRPEIIQRECRIKSPVMTPATELPEADLLKPLLLLIDKFELVRSTAAPWNLRPAYFQGKKQVKSMPPPQPWPLPLEESVKVVPSSKVLSLVLVPPSFVPVTYVAKAPISNSFPLKES
jgi:hypothetical protein